MSVSRPARPRPHLLGEVAIVLCLIFGYDRVASIGNVNAASAVRHGWAVLSVERSLHVSVESMANHWLAARVGLGRALSVFYDFGHATVTFGVLLAVYVWHAAGYRRARTALLAINGVALLLFLVLPVAPPRLLPGAGFVDVVAHSGTWGAWEAAGSTVAEHADRFAAMPSLHAAWAVWVVRAVWTATRSSWARALTVVHLAATVLVVVATGNHYLVDVVAGAVLAEATWRVVGLRVRPVAARPVTSRPVAARTMAARAVTAGPETDPAC
jgi:hypothetical protein